MDRLAPGLGGRLLDRILVTVTLNSDDDADDDDYHNHDIDDDDDDDGLDHHQYDGDHDDFDDDYDDVFFLCGVGLGVEGCRDIFQSVVKVDDKRTCDYRLMENDFKQKQHSATL